MPLAADGVVLEDETGEGPALAHASTVAHEESLAVSDGGPVGVGGRLIGRRGVGGGDTGTTLLLGLDGGRHLVGRRRGVLEGLLAATAAALLLAVRLALLVVVGRGLEGAVGIGGRQVLLMTLAAVDDGLELEGGQLALLDDVGRHGEVVCTKHMQLEGVLRCND